MYKVLEQDSYVEDVNRSVFKIIIILNLKLYMHEQRSMCSGTRVCSIVASHEESIRRSGEEQPKDTSQSQLGNGTQERSRVERSDVIGSNIGVK